MAHLPNLAQVQAFNEGVRTVLRIASESADAIERMPNLKVYSRRVRGGLSRAGLPKAEG